jgi:hypothetical protein
MAITSENEYNPTSIRLLFRERQMRFAPIRVRLPMPRAAHYGAVVPGPSVHHAAVLSARVPGAVLMPAAG